MQAQQLSIKPSANTLHTQYASAVKQISCPQQRIEALRKLVQMHHDKMGK